MSTTLRRTAAAASALVLAATLAACTSGDGNGTSSGELTWEDSPLAKYWEVFDVMGDMTQEEQQAFYDERMRNEQELVAQCMADQGFDYNPENQNGGVSFSSDEDGPEWGTVEYAQQYGYGAFTWEDQQPVDEDGEPEVYTDPNAWVYEELSESEIQAWQEALWGAPSEDEFDPDAEAEWEWNWEEGGCYGWAQHEMQENDPWAGISQLQQDPRFAELFEQMNRMWTDVEADPRMAEINNSWATCMADAGYDFANPNEAQESIYELSNTLWEDHDGTETWEPDPALIEQYKAQELETAVADFTCRDEGKYESERLRVQFAIEQDFIDNNKAALDEFTAAAQELQK